VEKVGSRNHRVLGVACGAAFTIAMMVDTRASAAAITTADFPIPTANSNPVEITPGPDGNLWFTEQSGNNIGRITTSGAITEFAALTTNSEPWGITAGPDGNLWFTERAGQNIGRITTQGVITEFVIPNATNCSPDIVAGSDGNLWFTECNNIGRITTGGVITEFPVPTGGAAGIAAGPDGNVWFTETSNNIGLITPAGAITEFAVPTASSVPWEIAAGPDGNLWFTERFGNKIGQITTAGVITEFTVPTANTGPWDIAAGPDGNMWFTERGSVSFGGRITTAGTITEFALPSGDFTPGGIAAGPDGNIWFTSSGGNRIVKVALPPPAPTGLRAVPGDGEATVTWTPPPSGTSITGYTIVASPGGATTTVSPVVPAATVTGLTNGTPYTFTVAAINAAGSGPASVASAVVTPIVVAQGPSVAVLPAMSNEGYGGYLTTAYLKNTSGSAANIRVQYFDTSGLGVGSGNSVAGLMPGATWTLRTDNGDSLAATQAGSAVVYSDQPLAVFVNEFAPGNTSDATSYSAINVTSGIGSTLYAPAIANNAYGGYTTGIGLVSLATGPTSITVTYRDGTGATIATQTLPNVAAGAYQGIYSGAAGLPSGFAGTATVASSGGNLAAVVNETGPGNQFSSYDAVPAGSTTLYAPAALRNAYGGYNTGMGIQNTTGGPGTVTITYYDASGNPTVTTHPIAANGYVGVYQGADIPTDGAYTAKLTSTVAIDAIVNEVAASTTSAQQSTAYDTFDAGSSSLNLPLVESAGADGWSTGEGIMNAGTAATTVTVTYFDTATGAQVGSSQSLPLQPNAFWGLYQPAGGLPNGTRASALVTTTSGGQLAVICNESNATSLMSYGAE
jgi:streptogramin lyase